MPLSDRPARLTSGMIVAALIRRVQALGGFATVIRRGDDGAGALLVDCRHRDDAPVVLEYHTDFDGQGAWRTLPLPAGDGSHDARLADYVGRRARIDPALWWIELDIADAPRLVVELTTTG